MVGGGDTALEEATYLSGICKKVTLIHRRDELRGSAIMQQRAFDKENIEIAWSRVIKEYLADENGLIRGVLTASTKGEGDLEIPCAGCFIAIGHDPNTQIFADQLDMKDGYIQIRSGLEGMATATSVPPSSIHARTALNPALPSARRYAPAPLHAWGNTRTL